MEQTHSLIEEGGVGARGRERDGGTEGGERREKQGQEEGTAQW